MEENANASKSDESDQMRSLNDSSVLSGEEKDPKAHEE